MLGSNKHLGGRFLDRTDDTSARRGRGRVAERAERHQQVGGGDLLELHDCEFALLHAALHLCAQVSQLGGNLSSPKAAKQPASWPITLTLNMTLGGSSTSCSEGNIEKACVHVDLSVNSNLLSKHGLHKQHGNKQARRFHAAEDLDGAAVGTNQLDVEHGAGPSLSQERLQFIKC